MAERSSCVRSQVGAVVVLDNQETFIGYNGPESGEVNCNNGGCPRGLKSFEELPSGHVFRGEGYCTAVHAEINALRKYLRAHPEGVTSKAVLFTTREPCHKCWTELLAAGFTINQIVWSN
ncbi:deoxycytidylate deaminase [Streptomyces phage Dryad]|nr:deoxycytidylate deaminase [Streptomyces phage Dryad]